MGETRKKEEEEKKTIKEKWFTVVYVTEERVDLVSL
jgi:hypothetical protein